MKFKVVFFLILIPVIALGKLKTVTDTDSPQIIERGDARRIFINGFAGNVTVTPGKSSEIVVKSVRFAEGEEGLNNSVDLSEVVKQVSHVIRETRNALLAILQLSDLYRKGLRVSHQ